MGSGISSALPSFPAHFRYLSFHLVTLPQNFHCFSIFLWSDPTVTLRTSFFHIPPQSRNTRLIYPQENGHSKNSGVLKCICFSALCWFFKIEEIIWKNFCLFSSYILHYPAHPTLEIVFWTLLISSLWQRSQYKPTHSGKLASITWTWHCLERISYRLNTCLWYQQ